MDWQPIETAPKDGTRMLGASGPDVSITSWDSFRKWINESAVTDDGYGWYGHDDWTPTHWMPLPAPPT